ncbi:retrovirus-related pol polyprotein from transposon TNT 1-94 [Tanacetum coccineum]
MEEQTRPFLADLGVLDGQAVQTIIPNTAAFQTEDLDTYDSDCDDISNAKAVLMANISNYGPDIISEVSHSETYLNDMENQSVHAMQDFEQPPAVSFTDNKIHSDSNIISESKEKEDKYMENKIDLEKKIKELDNILFKVGQSTQTMNMLNKPQALYDNIHKQALGYQNPFHLKKAKRIKPTLYDGIVMSAKHVAMPVIDDEETLILEEESRSKMFEKAKDPEVINKNISHKPIDYEKLNRLFKDFEKRFTLQQEMDAEQAFWFRISNPTLEYSNPPPVKVEVPSKLPKESLVNASLKKLKFHLAQFDSVVKKRTTPDARTEGEWGFEHTKAIFNNEIIPFLKSLKDIFNVFDRDLLNEIMEVQTVFNQINTVVQQFSVDKQCLEIAKKELFLENDRLLQQIMYQDVLLTVMNSMSLFSKFVNIDGKRKESCNLEAELLKSQNAFIDLLKSYSQLEKHSQLQDKDSTICKLKDIIKSMREKSKEENVNYDYGEIETKNVELENRKEIIDIVAQIPSANTIVPGMFKLDLEPLAPRLLQNREVHIEYLKYAQEQADIHRGIVVQIILWYLDSRCSKHMTGNRSQLMNFVSKFLGTVRFGNDNIVRIMGYGDYQLGNVTISRTISLDDMLKTSPICLLSKASKTKSWLWHDRLSHLNFGTLNKLTKDGLARGIPRLKFQKDHLCSACALGKIKKSSHQPKAKDTNQVKLYLLHMVLSWQDACGEY